MKSSPLACCGSRPAAPPLRHVAFPLLAEGPVGVRAQALVVQLLRVHGEGHSPYDIQKIAQHRARLQTGNPLSCWQGLAFIRGAAMATTACELLARAAVHEAVFA